MTALGLFLIGAACALSVLLAIYPRCGLCHRMTSNRVRSYGGRHGMSGRFCGECNWTVVAADANGAVEAIEREASKAINTMLKVA